DDNVVAGVDDSIQLLGVGLEVLGDLCVLAGYKCGRDPVSGERDGGALAHYGADLTPARRAKTIDRFRTAGDTAGERSLASGQAGGVAGGVEESEIAAAWSTCRT